MEMPADARNYRQFDVGFFRVSGKKTVTPVFGDRVIPLEIWAINI
jgi:hypothetical protein